MINELEAEGILSYNRHEICFLNVKNLQKTHICQLTDIR